MKKKVITWVMIITMLFSFVLPYMPVQAATTRIAVLTGDLKMRSTPSLTGTELGTVYKGSQYTILGEAQDDRPVTWYKITANGKTGWISSAYVTVKEVVEDSGNTVDPDEDFEGYLTEENFPESYKESLRALHALYPNWIFEAQHTGLEWDTVIKEEYKLGKNLVHTNSISSWKSTQTGAYNWETGKWVGLDGASWVAASKEIIEHYMDPRNFLDKTNIFQFLKQSYNPGYMSAEQIAEKKEDLLLMVDGTFLEGTYTEGDKTIKYVDTLMTAGERSGVCPLVLASMIIQEQGVNGTGKCIAGNISGYEGYYNYFNVGAYATSSMTAIQRGLWYAKGSGSGATSYNRPWDTRTKSIIGGAKYYGENYVAVGQDTMYLKKFNVQGNNIYNHQYMTNVQGGASEGQHMAEGYGETSRQAALIFKIPVFENMPETPAAKPTGNGDPNCMLKSLSVSDYSLTPTFDIYETDYAVSVPNSVTSVNVSATAVSSNATVSGTGSKSLAVGSNKFTITVKAQNGSTRTYNLTIVRQAAVVTNPVSISSSTYKVNSDNTITGIKTFPVSASNFAKNFAVTNGTVKVVNADGSAVTGNVGTGDQVKVYDANDNCKYTYDVIIYGDANGDGTINARDLLAIQKNNIKVSVLTGVKLTAADVNRDGKVNARDLLAVQKNNIKVSTIEQ